ncbi:sugar porter (SP) family MFS transporter [Actinomadura pelletieri DSM 43383]|uniref:Sugar porter (SP) family MFS transporter n=1 Tax=Actinomadura pelletieri DSM 43383 TaxID=1120940 RepID=A0A495QLI6_9ACTN|nr:sugar porter family MFS transporter [Actinomadura pelletieri]RKS73445.1 sugar porter (SP) family MFS transporter [Actinomadura pelletieri DSM 43383]
MTGEPLNVRPAQQSKFEELTPQGLKTARLWAVFITIGSFLFGFDTGIISGALLFIREDLGLTSFEQSSVVSVLLLGAVAGAVAGALSCGRIADRYGRRPLLAALGVVFLVGIVIAAAAHSYGVMLLARIIMGMAVGGVSATVPTYLGEIVPPQIRGRILSLNQLLITIGLLASYITNWVFADAENWRAMFAVGAIPSAALVIACIWLPESPRWLIRRGRTDEARRILERITRPGVPDRVIERYTPDREDHAKIETEGGRARALLLPRYRPALLVAMILAALQQFCGINTILYYAPTIMETTGLSASNAIYYSVFIGVVNVIITLVSLALIDRIGRRPLLIVSLAGMGLSIAMLGLAFAVELSPVITLAFMMLYIVAFGLGMGPVFWVLLGEIFPPALQAEGSSAGATVNWLSNFAVSLAFLPLIDALGQETTFWIFAGICVLGLLFVSLWVPETRGRRTHEVGVDLRQRWNVPEEKETP